MSAWKNADALSQDLDSELFGHPRALSPSYSPVLLDGSPWTQHLPARASSRASATAVADHRPKCADDYCRGRCVVVRGLAHIARSNSTGCSFIYALYYQSGLPWIFGGETDKFAVVVTQVRSIAPSSL